MSYIDTTFEKGGNLIKTLAKIHGGWNPKKAGFQFYDQQLLDYKGDITLRVAVWMTASSIELSRDFPLDFEAQFDDGRLRASIAKGRLLLSVFLQPELPWIVTSNGKPAVDWGPQPFAQYGNSAYILRHMIVFNLPSQRARVWKEWDLLPFLPGGLIERNRRRH
jgi:hypothetical protein